jgi:protein-S-isoprenylcysteine O-methyltransferase Ste14
VHPLPYTWLAGGPFWLACLWVFGAEWRFMRRSRRDNGRPTSQDAGSTRAIVWAGLIAIIGALSAAGSWTAAAMTTPQVLPYTAGIASIVAGGLLRRHCFAMLGPRFTYVVKATTDQTVVERGAYRYIRHPSYAAGLLLYGGIGLALGNWASLAISVTPLALAYIYRIAVEERALIQTIGAPYADYMKRTRRLIPFVL